MKEKVCNTEGMNMEKSIIISLAYVEQSGGVSF